MSTIINVVTGSVTLSVQLHAADPSLAAFLPQFRKLLVQVLRSLEPAARDEPSNNKRQKGGADDRRERCRRPEKACPAQQHHDPFAGQKSAGQAVADEEGHGNRQNTEIVGEYVWGEHDRANTDDRRLQ